MEIYSTTCTELDLRKFFSAYVYILQCMYMCHAITECSGEVSRHKVLRLSPLKNPLFRIKLCFCIVLVS